MSRQKIVVKGKGFKQVGMEDRSLTNNKFVALNNNLVGKDSKDEELSW